MNKKVVIDWGGQKEGVAIEEAYDYNIPSKVKKVKCRFDVEVCGGFWQIKILKIETIERWIDVEYVSFRN